jgi:hypothetical protein
MESGISFQELMHYNDAETRRWREFLEQDSDALGVQVDRHRCQRHLRSHRPCLRCGIALRRALAGRCAHAL